MTRRAFISGCEGLALSQAEERFFAETRPWGLILFARNIEDPDQVRKLVAGFRSAMDDPNAPVLIDQEGGRVQRLRPPLWREYPPAATIGRIHARDGQAGRRAAWLMSRLHAADLSALGITINCLPVLDVLATDAHQALGDRAYGDDVEAVAELGRAAAEGLVAGGVLPVIKHMPGLGRALVDSHHHLPVVEVDRNTLSATDFTPFRALAHLPLGMTTHVVYSQIDAGHPATTSKKVVDEIIRGEIGFDGLLMSDDISMNALAGSVGERAQAFFAAGGDVVLHCNGEMDEMMQIAGAAPPLSGRAADRAETALALIAGPQPGDIGALGDEFDRLTAKAA